MFVVMDVLTDCVGDSQTSVGEGPTGGSCELRLRLRPLLIPWGRLCRLRLLSQTSPVTSRRAATRRRPGDRLFRKRLHEWNLKSWEGKGGEEEPKQALQLPLLHRQNTDDLRLHSPVTLVVANVPHDVAASRWARPEAWAASQRAGTLVFFFF